VGVDGTAPLAEDDSRHGTVNGYGNLGCRCEACRTAHAAKHREYMAKAIAEGRIAKDTPHGTTYKYDAGCRCAQCRAAKAAVSRRSKARRRAART
jgi:hypothetical protein